MQFVLQTRQNDGKGEMQETILYSCHDFPSAVFGSYLRPDLVPANPSFYEGSSMGTISTSSIFVNVDNQTEERYVIHLPRHSFLLAVITSWLVVDKQFITMMQGCYTEGRLVNLPHPMQTLPTSVSPVLWRHMVLLVVGVMDQVTQLAWLHNISDR